MNVVGVDPAKCGCDVTVVSVRLEDGSFVEVGRTGRLDLHVHVDATSVRENYQRALRSLAKLSKTLAAATAPPAKGNRHERRRAAALARRSLRR